MAPKLYTLNLSPVARAVMMTCEYLKVPIELINVDLQAGHHTTPEYLKKNPLHTVPVFEDDDFVLHDSHAIIQYLADTYGKNDIFYPKESKQRAKINQILFFDVGYLFRRMSDITYPAFLEGGANVTQKQLDRIDEAYSFVEEFLTRTKYIASDHFTIADISAVASVTSLNTVLPLDAKKFPKTQVWIDVISKHEFYQKQNVPGLIVFDAALKSLISYV